MSKRNLIQKLKASLSVGMAAILLTTGLSVAPLYTKADSTDVQVTAANTSEKRNVMYYGDWSIWGGQDNFYPKDIPAEKLTHLNFAFLDFDAQGNLIFCDSDAATAASLGQPGVTWGDINAGILPALINLKAANPNLRTGVSLGGWSKSGDFSTVAANPALRAKLVENTLKFIEYCNMDFVDLDWEYPASVREPDKVDNTNDEGTPNSTPADKANYILLLQDFRAALDELGAKNGKYYELTVALPAPQTKLQEGIDIPALFDVVDFANMMTYDMRGAWDPISGHQTGLYTNPDDPYASSGLSVDDTVQYLLANGAPSDKIVIGVAFYTRGWENVSAGNIPSLPGLFGDAAAVNKDADQSPSRGANNEAPAKAGEGGRLGGVWSFRSIDKLKAKYAGLVEYWDDVAKAPYLYNASTGAFFTYDDERSVEAKAQYVLDHNLGGCISWMQSQDKELNSGSARREALTDVLYRILFGGRPLPVYENVSSPLDITATIETAKEAWGTGAVYKISFTNNERANESGAVLQAVENIHETIKMPKLYIKTDATITGGSSEAGSVTRDGEYVVVNLQGVYAAKLIKHGQTYNFELKVNGDVTVEDIESIEISQSICIGGVEYGRQTIYGEASNVDRAPVLSGVSDKTLFVGNAFNAMDGVSAYDRESGDLTSAIQVSGSVDTNTVGTYTLVYTVSDGVNTTTATRVITVMVKQNLAPVISGANNKTITVGASFDPMAGVTANDSDDGDLTAAIQVSGTVDTNTAGVYTLTYTVADSEGLEATVTRTVTVEEEPEIVEPEPGTYNPETAYVAGDVVTYNGLEYRAKWWVKGGTPGVDPAWELITQGAGPAEYVPGNAYSGGDQVVYNGQTYEAKWWTTATPGSDDSWKLV